jgi:hypothetical protein
MRLIYYSLARDFEGNHETQWIHSIRSLRRHNRHIPVCLLIYNGVSAALLEQCAASDVLLVSLDSYQSLLAGASPHASALALYPTLHKFLSIGEIDTTACTQVMFVDCDTHFFSDPELLFDIYPDRHWYAREAPSSRRCPHGYQPDNINEQLLADILAREGLAPVLPFNAGVCLFNHGTWNLVSNARRLFLDYLWRLLVGRHHAPADGTDDQIRQAILEQVSPADRDRALPYPSGNFWIAEEIALWLTFATFPQVTQGFFEPHHVAQGHEFEHPEMSEFPHIMAHYFSALQDRFFASRKMEHAASMV